MADSRAADDAIRAVLRTTAQVHYSKQSPERRAEVRRGFYQLDESQDGKISLAEFLKCTHPIIRNGSGAVISKIFSYVDEDKSGFLEFDEYLVFTFIMEAGFQMCDGCLAPVVIAGYTCKACWEQQRSGEGPATDSFNVCASCYASDTFSHQLPEHHLVPIALMYHHLFTTASPTPTNASRPGSQVQCNICNEKHFMGVDSALVTNEDHVKMLPNYSTPKFVCEWCATIMCIVCGKLWNGALNGNLQPMQWLREEFCCKDCNYGDGRYNINVEETLKLFEKHQVFKKCHTCARKLKDGTILPIKQDSKVQSPILADPITMAMESNLLLQQSFYHARMMRDYGIGMMYLAP